MKNQRQGREIVLVLLCLKIPDYITIINFNPPTAVFLENIYLFDEGAKWFIEVDD